MKPTAYIITCDRYQPTLCLPEGLKTATFDRGGNMKATPLYTPEQVGEAFLHFTPPLSGGDCP